MSLQGFFRKRTLGFCTTMRCSRPVTVAETKTTGITAVAGTRCRRE